MTGSLLPYTCSGTIPSNLWLYYPLGPWSSLHYIRGMENFKVWGLYTFHWLELSHVVLPNCKEGWEVQSRCMSKRKEKGTGEHTQSLPSISSSVLLPNSFSLRSPVISKHCTHGLFPIFPHLNPGECHFQRRNSYSSFSRESQHPPTPRTVRCLFLCLSHHHSYHHQPSPWYAASIC